MTGLDDDVDHILEIAAIVTDGNLNVLDEGVEIVIHQPAEVLALMGKTVSEMHARSGLTKAVRGSQVGLKQAEEQVLDYIKRHLPKPMSSPLCGNSVHTDRRFLRKWMPDIEAHLHYRVVDVTSVRLLAQLWLPAVEKKRPHKEESHRALDDILESIKELRFYKEHLFFLKELPS